MTSLTLRQTDTFWYTRGFCTGSRLEAQPGPSMKRKSGKSGTAGSNHTSLDKVMGRDRFALRKRLGQLRRNKSGNAARRQAIEKDIQASIAERLNRQSHDCRLEYDDELPICEHRERIIQAIAENQVIIIAGETGSGKTTQLPKMCLEAGRGVDGWIGCTQPRRLAARSICDRLAEEMNVRVGEQVGYQVRFDDRVSADSLIKVMTDGVLLSEIHHDRYLNRYDTLIIDEAHERSLNIDFLLGYLKQLLPRRPDLKLLITSATIDTARFSAHFDDARVIEVSGRSYPVEIRYRPPQEDGKRDDDLPTRVLAGIAELTRVNPRGDVLVFLPGERDIHDCARHIDKQRLRHTEVLPLFARMPARDQHRIFHPGQGRRIILATNIAETSLTVPGIEFVIDTGLVRMSRYSHRSKVQRLPIEAISQASANQRAGRCGRLGPGVCIRLYGEDDFAGRPEYTEPEILRTSLASVILQMTMLGFGDIASFPFLDKPANRFIQDGYQILIDLQALDRHRRITRLGREMASLPVDVRMARLLLSSRDHGVLGQGIVLAAVLSIRDPRERPLDAQQKADEAHEQFTVAQSDFLTLLNLWDQFQEQRGALSQGRLRSWCKQHFLSFVRMREWQDLVRQLNRLCQERSWKAGEPSEDADLIHQAILPAFVTQVGMRDEGRYDGTRQATFSVFPGSCLFDRQPKWLMTANLIETGKLYAHTNAEIRPEWIELAAEHLVKRQYLEPWWSEKSGQVMAHEQVSLFGLIIVARRQVPYARHNPEEAREIMIRQGLVPCQLRTRATFMRHNKALIDSIEELEKRRRKHDLMIDDERLYEFYHERLPDDMTSVRQLEAWLSKQPVRTLFMDREFLLKIADHDTRDQFPATIAMQGIDFKVIYTLAPGEADDGANLQIPLSQLNLVDDETVSWVVPGLLRDRVTALIRSLDKPLRRSLFPVADYVDRFLQSDLQQVRGLEHTLARFLAQSSSAEITAGDFDPSRVEAHLGFNYQIRDADRTLIAQGRDLAYLKQQYTEQARQQFVEMTDDSILRDGETEWVFGDLDRMQQGDIESWPAVVDQLDSVGLRFYESEQVAAEYHVEGVRRLAQLVLREKFRYLGKQLRPDAATAMAYTPIDSSEQLHEDLVYAVSRDAVVSFEKPVRSHATFQALLDYLRSELMRTATRIMPVVREVIASASECRRRLDELSQHAGARQDMQTQLAFLVYPGFLTELALSQLMHYPRYLNAMNRRIDRLLIDPRSDSQKIEQLQAYQQAYLQMQGDESLSVSQVESFHWLIEEFRVSLFAQELKTAQPVSSKRLEKVMQAIRQS